MANRIQVRRGTTTQWNDSDPVLSEGEIGYNSTLGQIKVGDGDTIWSELTYFATDAELNTSLEGYIEITEKGAVDGVAELNANKNVLTASSVIFEGATTNDYQTTITVVEPVQDATITIPNVTGNMITSGDTGTITSTMIADGAILNADINASAAIAVSKLAASTISGVTLGSNLNALTIGTGLSGTSYNGSSAVTVAIDSTVATLTGTQTLTNKTINGANNTLTVRIANDVSGLGTNVATFLATPSSANLISAVTDETGSGALVFGTSPTIATPVLTLSTTTSTTEGRIAWDSTNDKIIIGDGSTAREFASSTLVTNAQTGTTYTFVLADKDKIVELSNASAIALSIPTNSVAYPVGTQINILQTGEGQVTIAAGTPATTTVNGTPGLKLRAQWSSATLIKRATETWVAIGDLSA
jgi:hypothetical protein